MNTPMNMPMNTPVVNNDTPTIDNITPVSLCELPDDIIGIIFEYAGPVACIVRRHVCKWLKEQSNNHTTVCTLKTRHTCTKIRPCISHNVFCDDLARGTLETYLWSVSNLYAVNIVNKVIDCGNINIAQILIPISTIGRCRDSYIERVCASGHLELVKWIDQYFEPISYFGLRYTLWHNHVEIAEWIMTKSRLCVRPDPHDIQYYIWRLSPETCDLITRYMPHWSVPLHRMGQCHPETVELLLRENRIVCNSIVDRNEMRETFIIEFGAENATDASMKMNAWGLPYLAKWFLE